MIAAIQSLHPGLGAHALALLDAPQPTGQHVALTALINSIQRCSADITLVLDDGYGIAQPQIYQGLSFLLDQIPLGLHVVLLSREEPP